MLNTVSILEIEPSSKLNHASGIVPRCNQPKIVAVNVQISTKERNLVVKYIECFHSQLQSICFTETEILFQTSIPVQKGKTVNKVSRQVSYLTRLIEKENLSVKRRLTKRVSSSNAYQHKTRR